MARIKEAAGVGPGEMIHDPQTFSYILWMAGNK